MVALLQRESLSLSLSLSLSASVSFLCLIISLNPSVCERKGRGRWVSVEMKKTGERCGQQIKRRKGENMREYGRGGSVL